jgi:hypothetical protein
MKSFMFSLAIICSISICNAQNKNSSSPDKKISDINAVPVKTFKIKIATENDKAENSDQIIRLLTEQGFELIEKDSISGTLKTSFRQDDKLNFLYSLTIAFDSKSVILSGQYLLNTGNPNQPYEVILKYGRKGSPNFDSFEDLYDFALLIEDNSKFQYIIMQ